MLGVIRVCTQTKTRKLELTPNQLEIPIQSRSRLGQRGPLSGTGSVTSSQSLNERQHQAQSLLIWALPMQFSLPWPLVYAMQFQLSWTALLDQHCIFPFSGCASQLWLLVRVFRGRVSLYSSSVLGPLQWLPYLQRYGEVLILFLTICLNIPEVQRNWC